MQLISQKADCEEVIDMKRSLEGWGAGGTGTFIENDMLSQDISNQQIIQL